jgi:hypothetical protein
VLQNSTIYLRVTRQRLVEIQVLSPTSGVLGYREVINLPSRGDPMHFRLSLAVSAVSSFVPV